MKNIKGEFAPYFRGFLALFALSNCQKRDFSQKDKKGFRSYPAPASFEDGGAGQQVFLRE